MSISCKLRLRWEDSFKAEQSLSKLHVNSRNQTSVTAEQQWTVVMYFGLFCVFFLTFCCSEAGTGQNSSCARLHSSCLSPSEAGRPPGLEPKQMAVLQGAHFLQESSAGNAENQLENQVLHKASSLEPVRQKELRGSSAV